MICKLSRKIAIAQLCSTSSKIENMINVAKCAGKAQREQCSMLFLPECFGFIGESSEQTLRAAEPPIATGERNHEYVNQLLKAAIDETDEGYVKTQDSPVYLLDALRFIAKETSLWVSAGGMHVSGAPSHPESGRDRVFNSHVVLDNNGEVKQVYNKMHLFDVSIPGKVNLRESASTAPGKEMFVCDSPVGKSPPMYFFRPP